MKVAIELLAVLMAAGIELQADGDRLRYRPRGKVTPDLLSRLKAHKAELLAVLMARKTAGRLREVVATWPVEWRQWWEERAAIIEYDGNTPRPLDEDRAFHELMAAVLPAVGIHYTPGSIPTADLLGATYADEH